MSVHGRLTGAPYVPTPHVEGLTSRIPSFQTRCTCGTGLCSSASAGLWDSNPPARASSPCCSLSKVRPSRTTLSSCPHSGGISPIGLMFLLPFSLFCCLWRRSLGLCAGHSMVICTGSHILRTMQTPSMRYSMLPPIGRHRCRCFHRHPHGPRRNSRRLRPHHCHLCPHLLHGHSECLWGHRPSRRHRLCHRCLHSLRLRCCRQRRHHPHHPHYRHALAPTARALVTFTMSR